MTLATNIPASASIRPPARPVAPVISPRTRDLLSAPLASTFWKLAWPSVLIMMAQASTGLTEAWFVAKLGTDALAGMALVVPLVMLMQTLSGGSMGGAIASNIARALGAGQRDRANAIVAHALVVNLVIGGLCSLVVLWVGERLFTLLGGDAAAVRAALAYSTVVFAGMILLWLMNAMASVIRGTGNMIVPGIVICGGAVLLVPLSPCLIFGIGPIPAMGMAGAGASLLVYYAIGCAILGWYVLSGRNEATLGRARYDGTIVRSLLVLGGTGALNSTHINFAIAAVTGLVGSVAGPIGVGGYGVGTRLEYMLIPLAFGLGSPMLALVGTNIGAGQFNRALRSALVGGGIAFVLTETLGLLAAFWPEAWIHLFTDDPHLLEVGVAYLRTVGPFYGFFGAGLSLYFASQGAGRLAWPLIAALVRLIISIGGGWLALRLTHSLQGLFAAIGVGMVIYCAIICVSIKSGAWTRNRTPVPSPTMQAE